MADNHDDLRIAVLTTLRKAAAILVFGASTWALADPTDIDFALARDAFRAGDAAKLNQVAPRLKGHVLESYVTYWQFDCTSTTPIRPEWRHSSTATNGQPLADRLRGSG